MASLAPGTGGLPVVAIDGPAASGKSSTAREVARRLGLVHIDSGALYRTATWIAVQRRLETPGAIAEAAAGAGVELVRDGAALRVTVAGESAEPAIRSAAVTDRVSEVAAMPAVRRWVDALLRDAVADWGGGVMDGRDIGTVVFPEAALKVFLTATPEARARRRLRQDHASEAPDAAQAEAERLAERDRLDAGRVMAPLRQAPDALLLDTTALGFEEQVTRIVEWATARGLSAR
jgi:cytidylate kinase